MSVEHLHYVRNGSIAAKVRIFPRMVEIWRTSISDASVQLAETKHLRRFAKLAGLAHANPANRVNPATPP